ncbi:MAG: type VI secretion system secreted protein Hcp [Candidatus Promineifilaceae bacterium]|jgi:type VI secretion system secreted protein Hcp
MTLLLKKTWFRRCSWIAVGLLYLIPLVVVQGAFDMFIKIDGIEGESLDDKHRGWIDVLSVSQGVSRSVSGAGATRSNGVASFQDVSITKWLDKSSPKIMESVCNGAVFPKVEIDLVSTGATGQPTGQTVNYKLQNVLFTSSKQDGTAADAAPLPTESFSLNFTKIEYQYKSVDPGSGQTNSDVSVVCDVPATDP